MNQEFEATHKLRGSGYELRLLSSKFGEYEDRNGNRMRLPDVGVAEKITLPEPADGTLWRCELSGEDYLYCKQERKFFSLLDTMKSDEIPVEVYESKDRKLTRMYPYESGYPAGQMLQDVLDNFGVSRYPSVVICWNGGKVEVSLTTESPERTWYGKGETVEKAVADLNWNMIE